MKADPDSNQMDGMYAGNEAHHPNIMAMQMDYKNAEEFSRSAVLHHNGQSSHKGTDDTARQMHAYKEAIFKFRNHINFVERENHDLKRQIAGQVQHVTNGDALVMQQKQQFKTPHDGVDPLEDMRLTCAMLSERIKLMEEQNNALIMNAEQQRCDYERCLDRVSSQVFETLTHQRRLQMECDALRIQVCDLARCLPQANSVGIRSPEPSPIDNSRSWTPSHGGIPVSPYGYENIAHSPPNDFRNGYQPDPRFSFSPTLPSPHELISGSPDHPSSVIVQMLPPAAENTFHAPVQRYANTYNHQLPYGCKIPSNGRHYERRPPSHRTQGVARSPSLQTIPDRFEPPAATQPCTSPALAQLPGNAVNGSQAFFNCHGTQRLATDDGAVGRVSRSRDVHASPERRKVVRSRSFDEHSGYSRTNISPPSKPLSPHRLAVSRPQSQTRPAHTPSYVGQQHPPTLSFSSESLVSTSQRPSAHAQSQDIKSHVIETPAEIDRSYCNELLESKTRNDNSQIYQENDNITSTEVLNAKTNNIQQQQQPRQQQPAPMRSEKQSPKSSQIDAQKSLPTSTPSEAEGQKISPDNVWQPGRGGLKSALPLRPMTNRSESNNRRHAHEEDLPPPPPPPPRDDPPRAQDEKCPPDEDIAPKVPKKPVLSKRESYTAACQLSSLENLVTMDDAPKPGNISTQSSRNEVVDTALETHSVCPDPGKNVSVDDAESPIKGETEIPHPRYWANKLQKKSDPSTLKYTNVNVVARDGVAASHKISQAVSYDAIPSSTASVDTTKVPRRRSEGMAKDPQKRSRIAPASVKSRAPRPNISQFNSSPGETAASNPSSPTRKATTSTSCNDLLMATHSSPTTKKREFAHCQSQLPSFRMTASARQQKTHVHGDNPLNQQRVVTKNEQLESCSKSRQSTSGVDKSIASKKPDEISKPDVVEKKQESKKRNGSQKSFVGMMKSKFGVRGSSSKKTAEARERQQTNPIGNSETPSYVTEQRDQPSSQKISSPKNEVRNAVDDPTGRRSSNIVREASTSQDQLSKNAGKKGFLGRHNSKRAKNNGRFASFNNGEHFNNHPYGRVELIPVGSRVAISSDPTQANVSEANHEPSKDIAPADSNETSLSDNHERYTPEANGRRHNYENVVIHDGRNAPNSVEGAASHNYENVVIIRPSDVGDDVNSRREHQRTSYENVVQRDEAAATVMQRGSLLNPTKNSSNLSLDKHGSGLALHEIGGGRCVPGQSNSAKRAGIYTNEQQMFEKAFISSVVEAELNSKPAENDSGSTLDLAGKSDLFASTSKSSQSANSGFGSWPSKSAGSDLDRENIEGGSLNTRLKDANRADGNDVDGLQNKSTADSRSSLGSFGYGSGLSGSSTSSSRKSRSRSPTRTNREKNGDGSVQEARDSSSDSKLSPLPHPVSVQSRYAARKFASSPDDAPLRRLQKPQNVGKPRVKMGVSSILPPKTRCKVPEKDEISVKYPGKQEISPSQIPMKESDLVKAGASNIPSRPVYPGRFGVQRSNLPLRYSGSRQHHTG